MTRLDLHNVEGVAPAKTDRDGTQALRRAIGLLRIASAVRGGVGLSSLAETSGLATSTVHRTLSALVAEGMLVKDARTRRYRGCPLLRELGMLAQPSLDVRTIARSTLEHLADLTGDTAYLNTRSGPDALCLDLCEGNFPIKARPMAVGNRRPLGVGAAALAVLGALPCREATLAIARGAERYRRPGLTVTKLTDALRELRETGYVVTTGRLGASYRGIAVPVSDKQCRFALALSVSAVAERLGPARIKEVAVILQREGSNLAARLSDTD